MSRISMSIKNITYSITSQVLLILTQFILRKIFIENLGIDYLGINGLFANIISVLSFAELGVGTAIIYNLYQTVASKDDYKTASLLNFYKRVYIGIMFIIATIGVSLFPFLDYFIKNKPAIHNINYYYFFFLISTIASYFSVYKSSIIIAKQNNYVVTSISFLVSISIQIFQAIALILTKNYTLFLSINLIGILVKNIYITQYVNKLYPDVINNKATIDSETKSDIGKNIKGMIFQKIGGVMVDSTDNIIISSFIGLNYVGLYSNYYMVILALRKLINNVFEQITSSLGNLCAQENIEKAHEVFLSINFINFWMISYIGIGIVNCINPLIGLWIGDEYLFTFQIVFVISLNFYLKGMRETLIIFKHANGLYWEERYKGIAEATINLIVSLILVNIFGFIGVLIGTAVSTITTVLWIEPYILYRNYFSNRSKYSLLNYFKKYALQFLIYLSLSFILLFLNNVLFAETTISNLLYRVILVTIVVNGIYIIIFHKTPEFIYFKEIALKYTNRSRK